MRYSKLFGKTLRQAPSDASTASHKYLFQAGYIRESTAGRYFMLPLGQKVHDKISRIIEEEMDRAGAQRMFAPVLHPIELWEETNRDKSGGYELMTVEDRRGARFALGGTAEEMFVDVVRGFKLSYKDLPFNIYQFGYKFRDELRARGGLLRVREFVMKDGYSFHATDEDFVKEYENMSHTYSRIFKRIGLEVDIVPADNGYFGGDYCDEFVVECEVGESTYFVSEDKSYIAHEDIAKFKREEINFDEEIKPMQTIDQPDWVRTMDDNIKHYNLPANRFLKNVVYKNRDTGEIIIATIRGDLQVNKNKLEKVLGMVGLLEDATNEDLASIGTKPGYVHSWGHKGCRYIGDTSLKNVRNFIGGQKEETTDTINVNYGIDFEHEITADIAKAEDGFLAENGSKLIEKKGVEVGNIFQLGQHYSLRMRNAVFADSDGTQKHFFMGCYGIGVGRTMATVVEKFSDEKGIMWPEQIAPYKVQLISLGKDINAKAEEVYNRLVEAGIEVLWDDREESTAGEKFADYELIGVPYRVVFSEKSQAAGGVEFQPRKGVSQIITVEELIKKFA